MTFATAFRSVCITPPPPAQPAKRFALPGDGWYSMETAAWTFHATTNPEPSTLNRGARTMDPRLKALNPEP